MQAKLRQIGNSVGMIISASDLKALSAQAGDTVELEIKKVIRSARQGWDDPTVWAGAAEEPIHLEGLDNDFDREEDWRW